MWKVNIARRENTPLHPGVVNLRRVISIDEGDTRTMLHFSGGSHVYISSTEEIPQFVQIECLPSTIWTVRLSHLSERGDHRYDGRINARAISWVEKLHIIDEDCELSYSFPTPKGMMFTDDIVFDQFFMLVEKATEAGSVWVNPTFVDFVALGDKRDTLSVNGDHFRIKAEWSVRENLGC